MNNKGFTLVEVLAVVVIIGVLGLIAVPSVISSINSGKETSYEIMIENIKTAAQALYEEVEYMGDGSLSSYNKEGKNGVLVLGESNSLTVTLQSLVSNGFLKGTKNEDYEEENLNSMILLNPITDEDMGDCKIIITKKVTEDGEFKVTYAVSVSADSENINYCPKAEDFTNES